MGDPGLTGIAALESEMRDRLNAKDAEIERQRIHLDKAHATLRRILVDPPATLDEPDTDAEVIIKLRDHVHAYFAYAVTDELRENEK
jgi:hypothetical protein